MSGKQHVQFDRKVTQRRQLLELADGLEGNAWVPFCGDGDLTEAVWLGTAGIVDVYAADLDPERVDSFAARFEDRDNVAVIEGDCDTWIIPDGIDPSPLAVIDLDSYAYPYDAWAAVTANATLADTCVVLFTDGIRQAIKRTGRYRTPDGEEHEIVPSSPEQREAYNLWWTGVLRPWWEAELDRLGFVEEHVAHYLRQDMCYWGSVIRRAEGVEVARVARAQRKAWVRFDDDHRDQYLDSLRTGHRRTQAARAVGVNPSTVRRAIQEDPTFADAVKLAEAEANEEVEATLFNTAKSGNVTAMIFWLTNRDPEHWADRRRPNTVQVQHSGSIEFDMAAAEAETVALIEEVAARHLTLVPQEETGG